MQPSRQRLEAWEDIFHPRASSARLLKIPIMTNTMEKVYSRQFYLIQFRSSCYLAPAQSEQRRWTKPVKQLSCCRATPDSAVPQEEKALLTLKTHKCLYEKSKPVHISPEQGFLEAERVTGEDFSFLDLQATDTSRKENKFLVTAATS